MSTDVKKFIIWGMTNLPKEICDKIRKGRREAGLSQSELAAEVGCKQSALSMFEQGDGTKLNEEVIEKLAEKFGIDIKQLPKKDEGLSKRVESPRGLQKKEGQRGYCPNPNCPSNHIYEVEGEAFARPDRMAADPVGGKYCALCGEVLEKKCPSCGAPIHDGAICSYCGERYVRIAN